MKYRLTSICAIVFIILNGCATKMIWDDNRHNKYEGNELENIEKITVRYKMMVIDKDLYIIVNAEERKCIKFDGLKIGDVKKIIWVNWDDGQCVVHCVDGKGYLTTGRNVVEIINKPAMSIDIYTDIKKSKNKLINSDISRISYKVLMTPIGLCLDGILFAKIINDK